MRIERETVQYTTLNRRTGNYDKKTGVKYYVNGKQYDRLKDAKKELDRISNDQ